jgi:glycosyltransferase involved in cell wall biosynthesis
METGAQTAIQLKRMMKQPMIDMVEEKTMSLILPTYNEKDSICQVITDFESLRVFDEIIVINNNAAAGTSEEVAKTSAREVFESTQGYGAAILRGFLEARGDIIVVCEPDDTFIASDVFKLIAYADLFDIVYGSRTMNDMIWEGANMGWFLRFGNWSVAKLAEVLFNTCPLTDVGCTFRLVHRRPMLEILSKAKVTANFFGPEMMLLSFLLNHKVVQIPVSYKDRVGQSSVTGNKFKAFLLGLQMIWLIVTVRLRSINRRRFLNNRQGIFCDRMSGL